MKHQSILILSTIAMLMVMSLASCDDDIDTPETPVDHLSLNGACEFYEVPNSEISAWTLTGYPEWVTPVKVSGTGSEPIKIYVESNSSPQTRGGEITIGYANGQSRSVGIDQSNEQPAFSIQRSYAVGWSFDVRTYMDSRGLRGQVFNTQKLANDYPDIYVIERNSSTNLKFFYGEDANELSKSINAKLDLDIKSTAFKLEIYGTFGMSVVNDSKRIFSWIRGLYIESKVYLNNIDMLEAQESDWFTTDFAAERNKVIAANGSEQSISDFIDRYGTHIILDADLGGCYDYYFSSVYDKEKTDLDIQAALEFGYATKFKLNADVKYKDMFEKISSNKIEKFAVKGGDAVSIANQVFSGSSKIDTDGWLKGLRESKNWELLSFRLEPISILFPEDIAQKVSDYLIRLYYKDVPLTRSELK